MKQTLRNILSLFVASAIFFSCQQSTIKLMNEEDFKGTIDGKEVSLYTLQNENGVIAQVTNFGGRVVSLWVPDKNKNMLDIVTGFPSLEGYQNGNEAFFGALIGRYGNRIAKGKFTLDGVEYTLPLNNGENHLHGGPGGFHNVVWDANQYKNDKGEDVLELNYLSKDGEAGYPGNLSVKVWYTLTNDNEFKIEYSASTDKATPVNITHHSFFNLHGFSSGVAKEVNSHIMKINASHYNPTDAGLIPTGEIATVEVTPMDFREFTAVGERIDQPFEALENGLGYDHNWILDKNGEKITEAAVIYEPSTGIQMSVYTDQPAMQFYGGNFFKGKDTGKYGEVYNYRTSFAMETQHYPDSPNQPAFPNTILRPGENYEHLCIYKFDIR
jgi:aldose 1-epimerase